MGHRTDKEKTVTGVISAVLVIATLAPLLVAPSILRAEDVAPAEILPEEGVPLAGPGATGITGAASCFTQAGAAAAAIGATQSTPGLPVADVGARISQVLTTGGTILNCVGTFFNLIQNTVTAGGVGYLVAKSKVDAVATGLVKTAIQIARDMVIRWILTGRFEGPVFSTSFSADTAQAAENASRIFLSTLTGYNFCRGFDIPQRLSFPFDFNFQISCTLPGRLNNRSGTIDFFLHPEQFTEQDRLVALQPENLYPWVLTNSIQAKANTEARAITAFAAEYAAGSGFLPIKDRDGKVTTPGQAVAQLVIDQEIRGPREEATVVQTIQQAIGAIVDTAIRATLERGLGAVFKKK